MGLFHDILLEARAGQFEKDLKEAYGMGFRDGRLCPADLRPCTVNGSPAFFHRWADEDRGLLKINAFTRPDEREHLYQYYRERGIVPECCSIEALRRTVALVEMPDGSIKTVPATEIRFTDREG